MLAEPSLRSLLLPALRADFELVETYEPLPGGRLRCPVTAYLGNADPDVAAADLPAWAAVTDGPFTTRRFDGDHFYLAGGPPAVPAAVREDIRRHR